ncbi:methyl-accepting chemotaxis protein CtpH [mine drainage metagenome]|uniref:Methyl-accepting chemotaxis protein CtpH n=1 Tax=mine drainage metagenome TaxID=410659 RepID=A0A1J5RHF6_9ZZZZ
MNKLKTSTKLLLLAVSTSALLVLLGAAGIWELRSMTVKTQGDISFAKTASKALIAIENAHKQFKDQLQDWKNILIRGNDPASFDQYLTAFSEKEKKVDALLTTGTDLMQGLGLATGDLETLKSDHAALGARYRDALRHFDKTDPNTGKAVDKLVRGLSRQTGTAMDKTVSAVEKHYAENIDTEIRHNQARYESARNIFIALILAGLALTTTISIAIRSDLMGQLGGEPAYAAEVTRRIAAGDLTTVIEVRSGDDSSLLVAMKQMRESLHDAISQILAAANQLADDATKMNIASDQVSAGSDKQSEATSSMAAAMEEMAVSIQHVASSADDAHNMATEAGTLSSAGEGVVKNAVLEINKIADSFRHSSELISSLSEQSNKISTIVNVIKEIADQTNLLALNAAIEAARAGEQGRGFAVVADEVRKLAERTTSSTLEISEMIHAIQSGAQDAMQSMTEGGTQVGRGVGMAAKAGDSITHIEASSRNVLASVTEISSALQEQSSTSNLIAQNVEKIAQMTEENGATIKNVKLAADRLEQLSGKLKSLVARFRV